MTIHISWYNDDQTTILQVFEGEFSVEELSQVAVKSAAMITGVPHRVDQIIDFSKVNFRKVNLLGAMRTVDRKTPDNQGIVVLVGVNPYLQRLLGMAHSIAPKSSRNLQIAQTIPDAVALLAKLRESNISQEVVNK